MDKEEHIILAGANRLPERNVSASRVSDDNKKPKIANLGDWHCYRSAH